MLFVYFCKKYQSKMNLLHKYILITLLAVLSVSCNRFIAIERNNYLSSDTAFVKYVAEEQMPYSANNSVTMLDGAREKFDSLFNDIRNAKHHIHLEYFNFRHDSINNVLLTLLAQKAKEGVEVRAMFDAFGNLSNNQPLKRKDLEEIRATGIEIIKFDPIVFPWINHFFSRDHRKIVIIDGEKAYIGGINVADYYINGIKGIGEWRDMHSKVEGQAVNDLQQVFLDIWNKETKQNISGEAYLPLQPQKGEARIAVVDRRPHETPERMRQAYANAIHSAKDSIILVNPYFLPMPIVRKALEKAIDDSVKVTIILSEKGDIPMVPDGAWRVGYQLMKRGAKVYMYTGGFNHSKAMCIDGKFCSIGSANFNSRSMRYDYETNIFVFSKEETAELYELLKKDISKSYLLTEEKYKKRCLWHRFSGWLATILTPLM